MKRTLHLSTCLLLALSFLRCGGQEPVSVGAVLPLSGEFAIYGEPIRKGVDLAFEEIQAREDFPYPLELDVRDSQGDPERATQLLGELYDTGSPAVIGGVTTEEAIAMVSVADQQDRVLLSPSASSPRLTGISTNFYRVFPSDFLEGTKMGHFATETLNVESVVIVASESPYAKGIQQVFRQELERRGGEVLDAIEYPRNTSDLAGVLERVMTLSPQAVYLADYADGLVTLLEGLAERGFEGKTLTTSSIASAEVLGQAGDAAEGVLFTQSNYNVSAEEEHIQKFVTAYRDKYGSDPDLYAAHGYDAMRIYARALREGGPRPRNFWQGMRAISGFPGVTGAIQFDEQGDVQKFPRVYIIQEGQFVDYDKVLEERRRRLEKRREELRRQMRELENQRRALEEGGGDG